jgi:hypothetical protein
MQQGGCPIRHFQSLSGQGRPFVETMDRPGQWHLHCRHPKKNACESPNPRQAAKRREPTGAGIQDQNKGETHP